MEKLKLVANRPEVIALQFTQGKPVSSSFGGDQVLYTLADGRQFYVSPFVAQKIDSLNLAKGEQFEVCKRERIEGQHRKVEFEVRSLTSQPEPPRRSMAMTFESALTRTAAPPSVPSTQQSDNHAVAQVVNQPTQQPTTDQATNLDLALRYAIDAAAAAEQYAKTIDYALRFTSEDIRAMALSKFIAMDRNPGGGKWSN